MASVLYCAFAGTAAAQVNSYPVHNMFGTVGMIDMPSARMAPDGELSAGASFFENTQHYNFTFQALPWLETSFRYTGLDHFNPDYPVYYDRAFGAKLRLWQESEYFPALAIGINDLVGTGIYNSEYLVGSKQMGPLDFTLGIGWGRMATANTVRNPLALIIPSFEKRSTYFTVAGQPEYGAFFHGHDAGIFGGMVWHTPLDGLSLIVEYSSDSYIQESTAGNFSPRNQVNFGASYQVPDSVSLALNWLYGRSIGGNLTFQLDPTTNSMPQKLGPEPPPVHLRTQEEQARSMQAYLRNRNGIVDQGGAARLSMAQMVDVIWREARGARDVSVSGKSLVITMPSPTRAECERLAHLVAPLAENMSLIVMQTAPGQSRQNCPLSSKLVRVFSAALGPDMPAFSLVRLADVVTIDASAPPPPSRAVAIAAIKADARMQKIGIEAISLTHTEISVYYANGLYRAETDVVDRLLRILMQQAPLDVEKFRLIPMEGGMPVAQFEILRAVAERSFDQTGYYNILQDGPGVEPAPDENPELRAQQSKNYPRVSWSIFPQFHQQLFDPSNPFGVQLLTGASVGVELLPGLSIQGEGELSLFDNFNTGRLSDSQLPHVRSDFVNYFTKGKNGIGNLEADYTFRLTPELFARARVGLLESMFAGAGGEVLWRPQGQRWALGADLFAVQQRGFDRLLGLQPYRQVTGHVSLYYDSPWYDLNFMVRAGQYLAGDRGLTLQISRRFSTGVEIGVFATKTNVSASRFGEGSFDKGIMIRIPLDWAIPIQSQAGFALDLRPVQRDGGQVLAGDASLYEITRRESTGEIIRDIENTPH